ncbi:unnamed protein product [Hapterophycus canaliculatus]
MWNHPIRRVKTVGLRQRLHGEPRKRGDHVLFGSVNASSAFSPRGPLFL